MTYGGVETGEPHPQNVPFKGIWVKHLNSTDRQNLKCDPGKATLYFEYNLKIP